MPKTKTFDAAEYLGSPEMIAAYLTESFESDDPVAIALAVQAVERAQQLRKHPDNRTSKTREPNHRNIESR
jgi:DNA-binding phage protein